MGDICQLEVFCAPFGRRVRECIFFYNVYIGYMPPTFGEQMSVDFVHFPRAQLSGGPNSPLFQGGQLGPGQLSPGAQLSAPEMWTVGPRTVGPQGPTVRGPTVHPQKVDSWAPDSWAPGPNCPGPNYPGPNCPGPNCPGPNSPRTVWGPSMLARFFRYGAAGIMYSRS